MFGCCLEFLLTITGRTAARKDVEQSCPDVRVLEELGRGAFGIVFKAKNVQTQEFCAVKSMRRRAGNNEIKIMEMLQEQTTHENIVRLMHHTQDVHFKYMMLELCDGGDLKMYLKDNILTERDSSCVVLQVLKALQHMHKLCIVHCDVKLGNVFLSTAGDFHAKLADFGSALELDPKTLQTCQWSDGTPQYSAPEVYGGPWGLECDMWSLGVMLYKLVGRGFPFHSRASMRWSSSRKNIDDDRLTVAWQDATQPCKELYDELLKPDRSRRITAAGALEHGWVQADCLTEHCQCDNALSACSASTASAESIGVVDDEEDDDPTVSSFWHG